MLFLAPLLLAAILPLRSSGTTNWKRTMDRVVRSGGEMTRSNNLNSIPSRLRSRSNFSTEFRCCTTCQLVFAEELTTLYRSTITSNAPAKKCYWTTISMKHPTVLSHQLQFNRTADFLCQIYLAFVLYLRGPYQSNHSVSEKVQL